MDAATADRLLADAQPTGGVVFVVADRVTGTARDVLTSRGAATLTYEVVWPCTPTAW